jgi:hypothetical protein
MTPTQSVIWLLLTAAMVLAQKLTDAEPGKRKPLIKSWGLWLTILIGVLPPVYSLAQRSIDQSGQSAKEYALRAESKLQGEFLIPPGGEHDEWLTLIVGGNEHHSRGPEGGFQIGKSRVTARRVGGRLLISCKIAGPCNQQPLVIEDNKWKVDRDSGFWVDDKPNTVTIFNRQGETVIKVTGISRSTAQVFGIFWYTRDSWMEVSPRRMTTFRMPFNKDIERYVGQPCEMSVDSNPDGGISF